MEKNKNQWKQAPLIQSKYGGYCCFCKKYIPVGSRIVWNSVDRKIAHVECVIHASCGPIVPTTSSTDKKRCHECGRWFSVSAGEISWKEDGEGLAGWICQTCYEVLWVA